MTKLLKVILGIGLVLYLFVLIIKETPATLITSPLAKALPQLQLAAVTGTIWEGKAGDAVVMIQNNPLPLGALKWKFKPMSLLALKACADVESSVFSGNACRTLTGMNQLHRFQADLPAALANDFIPQAEVAGAASLGLVEAAFNNKAEVSKLKGNLSWRGARVKFQGTWFTLGDLAADLKEAEGGALAAHIFDLSGPFGIDVNAKAGLAIAPSLVGDITPRENAPAAITDGLSLIAIPQDNGALRVTYPLGGSN